MNRTRPVPSRSRGRPPRRGLKSWHRSRPLERLVRSVMAPRRKGDELAVETNAEIVVRVTRIGARWVGRPLTPRETWQLQRMARTAKPSRIIRLLYQWRGGVTDRQVRDLAPRVAIDRLMWA